MRKDSNVFGPVHCTAGCSYPAWIPSRCRDRCERRLDPGSHRSSSLPCHAFSLAVAAAVEACSYPLQRRLGSWIDREAVEVGGRIGKREGRKEGKREEGRGEGGKEGGEERERGGREGVGVEERIGEEG